MRYIKRLFAVLGLLILAAACGQNQQPINQVSEKPYTERITVGRTPLYIQRVTSPQDMANGLSGRPALTDNQGMLFDFGAGTSTEPSFWMKDMLFDLDLVWIKNNTIIGITKNVPAPKTSTGQLPVYSPPAPVDAVLEVNAGWTDSHEIQTGTTISEQ